MSHGVYTRLSGPNQVGGRRTDGQRSVLSVPRAKENENQRYREATRKKERERGGGEEKGWIER